MATVSRVRMNVTYRGAPRTPLGTVEAISIGPLLEIALSQVQLQGAYVYRVDRNQGLLHLAHWRGVEPTKIDYFNAELEIKTAEWYFHLAAPTIVEDGAWSDWRFQDFPEFLQNRFEGVASIPLLHSDELIGIANFCRRRKAPYGAPDLTFLRKVSQPLTALLGAATARVKLQDTVEKLSQQLADRKLLDRAKGILQLRFAWSEEAAYFYLRRTSRKARVPMREVAQQVIESADLPATDDQAIRTSVVPSSHAGTV